MKLKTLKDLDRTDEFAITIACKDKQSYDECIKRLNEANITIPEEIDEFRYVKSDDARKEAINWIKELNIIREDSSKDWNGWDSSFMAAIVDYIQHFFNITKEDLK